MNFLKLSSLTFFTFLLCISCSGGNSGNGSSEETIAGAQGGQQVVSQDIIDAAQAQRNNTSETIEEIAEEAIEEIAEEVGVLSVEEVEVEELVTEIEEEVEEEIDVATAEEDPLEGLLNGLSIFNTCMDDEGFEFIGVPGQPGPDGETLDPDQIEPGYIEALQKCATQSNILDSLQTYSDAQANLTTEQIAQTNFGIPVFKECMERLGWEVEELAPDARGLLQFGQNGTGLTPPEGTEQLDPEDIFTCRSEAQTYTSDNYVTEEE